MRPQSAKAKGRRLQQEVRDAVLATFASLEPDDVRSTSMGASGADVLLSPAARKLFPFYVEAKNRETINIWKALEQAEKGAGPIRDQLADRVFHPLVVFRRNNSRTYAALPFDLLMRLVVKASDTGWNWRLDGPA